MRTWPRLPPPVEPSAYDAVRPNDGHFSHYVHILMKHEVHAAKEGLDNLIAFVGINSMGDDEIGKTEVPGTPLLELVMTAA
jgi:hypothetical protein